MPTPSTFEPGLPCEVTCYTNDVVIHRHTELRPTPKSRGTRNSIATLSEASRKRLLFTLRNTEKQFNTLITLTYPNQFPLDGKTIKRHLHHWLVSWSRRWGSPTYLWFLEFQKRGAAHYHIFVEWDGPGLSQLQQWVSRSWYDVVGSEDKKHLRAGTNVEWLRKDAIGYALKYAAKKRQKTVPPAFSNVGRLWGNSRNVKPAPLLQINTTERGAAQLTGSKMLPQWAVIQGKAGEVACNTPNLLL